MSDDEMSEERIDQAIEKLFALISPEEQHEIASRIDSAARAIEPNSFRRLACLIMCIKWMEIAAGPTDGNVRTASRKVLFAIYDRLHEQGAPAPPGAS